LNAIPLARAILMVFLSSACLFNIALAVRRRNSPAERRGCLLAAASCLLLAAAIWAQVSRQNVAALTACGLSIACALAWFYHIYLQSLHNTTM